MKYRKKPVVIDAVLWDGRTKTITPLAPWNCAAPPEIMEDRTLRIETLEGVMTAQMGDYVIKGVTGELYPCKPEIFHKTYEWVAEAETQEA